MIFQMDWMSASNERNQGWLDLKFGFSKYGVGRILSQQIPIWEPVWSLFYSWLKQHPSWSTEGERLEHASSKRPWLIKTHILPDTKH